MIEKQFLEMDDRERDVFIERDILGNKVGVVRSSADNKIESTMSFVTMEEVPDYDDYNAMMRVVEKMESEGYSWEIGCDMNAYMVSFSHMDSRKNNTANTWATSLLNQVYLAAGRALGKIE